MSAPSTVTFYGPAHLGYAFDDDEHSGQDIDSWPAGTEIPALRTGTFAGGGWHKNYGYWGAVDIGGGWYLGTAHMQGPTWLRAGTVQAGVTVGKVGSTGAFARGAHVHLYLGRTPHPADRPKSNPLGTITAALNVKPLSEGSNDMPMLISHPDGTITTIDGTSYQHHTLATYPVDKRLYGAPLALTAAEFAQAITNTQIRRAYLFSGMTGGGSTVDPAAIATKVDAQLADDFARLAASTAALSTAIAAGQFGPTLAQIDAADDEEHAALGKQIMTLTGKLDLVPTTTARLIGQTIIDGLS